MIADLGKTIFAESIESALSLAGVEWSRNEHSEIHGALQHWGLVIIPNFYGPLTVAQLRKEVEQLLTQSERVWIDEQGSDRRLFGADRLSTPIRNYLEDPFIHQIGARYCHNGMKARLTLAAKLIQAPDNLGSGGGWHRDSPVRRQFKSLLYLSKVGPNNGPFEYLIGSHKKTQVLKLVANRLQSFRQYRFTDSQVEQMIEQCGFEKKQVTGNPGDLVLVDTKGIHRGAPILEGTRFALTNYFWGRKIPEHMAKLIPSST